MKVFIDNIEYDVPEPVGKKVREADSYRSIVGGKSPAELDKWLDEQIDTMEKMKETIKRIEKFLNK